MPKGKYLILFGVFLVVMLATSGCDVFFPPAPLDLGAVPVYPGAERFDPSENSFAADRYRQDRTWVISGHKASVNAYALPKGTTSGQVKAFYNSQFSKLGGRILDLIPDNGTYGDLDVDRGMQSIFIFFSAETESPVPILLIENYTVNGCSPIRGPGCTPGHEMVHTCPPGLELRTVTSSRPNNAGNGTIYASSDYCYDSAGKRSAPGNAYATPTP
jgi:hypothetical protein